MQPVCNYEHFQNYMICNVTDQAESYACYGCQHYSFYESINHISITIIIHFFQIIVVMFSQLVGLGAEIQKTSILMGLLKYNEYEATNITYFISAGSSILYLLYLFVKKKHDLVDIWAVQLLFPFIVVFTDIGNFFNRIIYDQLIVLITISLELIWMIFIIFELKKEKDHQEKLRKTQLLLQVLQNEEVGLGTVSVISDREQPNIIKANVSSLIQIFAAQIFLQALLFFGRGGNPVQFFKLEYAGNWYIGITFGIYLLGFCITFFIYNKQTQQYNELKNYYNFYQVRAKKYSALLIIIGLIAFFCSGVAGVGTGLILIPFCIIIKGFRMSIFKTIRTLIVLQFLIDISVMAQAYQNYSALEFYDKLFYFIFGVVSSFFTIFLDWKFFEEKNQLRLLSLIWILLLIDFVLGAVQALYFKSPIQGNPYFSASIDDCSNSCQYIIKQ